MGNSTPTALWGPVGGARQDVDAVRDQVRGPLLTDGHPTEGQAQALGGWVIVRRGGEWYSAGPLSCVSTWVGGRRPSTAGNRQQATSRWIRIQCLEYDRPDNPKLHPDTVPSALQMDKNWPGPKRTKKKAKNDCKQCKIPTGSADTGCDTLTTTNGMRRTRSGDQGAAAAPKDALALVLRNGGGVINMVGPLRICWVEGDAGHATGRGSMYTHTTPNHRCRQPPQLPPV